MTHSLLYTIDPFTDTGIFGTLKVTKQWIVQWGRPLATMWHLGQTITGHRRLSA